MVPKPHPVGAACKPLLSGAALIVGNNPAVAALQSELARLGTPTFVLQAGDDPAAAIAELERLWQRQPIHHLFLLTPRDAEAVTHLDEAAWQQRQLRKSCFLTWYANAGFRWSPARA